MGLTSPSRRLMEKKLFSRFECRFNGFEGFVLVPGLILNEISGNENVFAPMQIHFKLYEDFASLITQI